MRVNELPEVLSDYRLHGCFLNGKLLEVLLHIQVTVGHRLNSASEYQGAHRLLEGGDHCLDVFW